MLRRRQAGPRGCGQCAPPRAAAVFSLILLAACRAHGAATEAAVIPRPAAALQGGAFSRTYASFRPMFVLLGDSHTEFGFDGNGGWGDLLQAWYSRRADVVNRGYGGYNSRMGLYVLDEFLGAFPKGRIKMVVIGFGSNDAAIPGRGQGQLSVPLAEYKANLVAMVGKLRWNKIPYIIIATPPPVSDRAMAGKLEAARINPVTRLYALAACSVAKELGLPCANVYGAITYQADWDRVCIKPDGLHLTTWGNKVMYDTIRETMGNAYPELKKSNMPIHMPYYLQVNAADPASTFNELLGYKVTTGVSLPAPAVVTPQPRPTPTPAPRAAAPAPRVAVAQVVAPAVRAAATPAPRVATAAVASTPTPVPARRPAAGRR